MVEEDYLEHLMHSLGKVHRIKVLYLLGNYGDQRFTQLHKQIPSSSKVFSECLIELTTLGFIIRRVDESAKKPYPVWYSLTKKGERLVKLLAEIQLLEGGT